jgi:putative oxidoreductase
VQRLFSTFADGWPGAGVLLLRLLVGSGLVHGGIILARSAVDLAQAVTPILLAVWGVWILVGWYTPIAGFVAAVMEAWFAVSHPGYRWDHIASAGLCLSVALIGPGAWSIDACLFGRKQIDLSTLERESAPPRKL